MKRSTLIEQNGIDTPTGPIPPTRSNDSIPLEQDLVRLSNETNETADNSATLDNSFALFDKHNPYHSTTAGQHPFGIQPEGNKYFSDVPSIRESGLGPYLSALNDEFICDNILSYCDDATLFTLQSTSKALYLLINGFDVEIWKERVIALTKGDFVYQWTWKATFIIEYQLHHQIPKSVATIPTKYINMYNIYDSIEKLEEFVKQERELYQQEQEEQLKINGQVLEVTPDPLLYAKTYPPQLLTLFPTYQSSLGQILYKCNNTTESYFSDPLFQPWITIDSYYSNKHKWEKEYNIERIDINSISVEQFNEKYSWPGKPVVLTNVTNNWGAVKEKEWSIETLLGSDYSRLGLTYICGLADLTLDKYLLYAKRCFHDDTPVYLFDKEFGEKNPHIPLQYQYPPHFSEDYFQFLQKHKRPSFRWWLIGPPRAGSSFHKDPLLTQAQNSLICGLKKWVLYPPHIVPPGITSSDDHLQVTAPFNVSEWFISYYHETQILDKKMKNKVQLIDDNNNNNNNNNNKILQYDPALDYPKQCSHYSHYKPVEIIQRPGETVFIPAQWWHMVINLDFSIAVTQNQINQGNYIACEKFLTKIEQPTLRLDLIDSVESKYPGMYEKCLSIQNQRFTELQAYHQQLNGGKDNVGAKVEVKRELVELFQNKNNCNQDDQLKEGFSFNFD